MATSTVSGDRRNDRRSLANPTVLLLLLLLLLESSAFGKEGERERESGGHLKISESLISCPRCGVINLLKISQHRGEHESELEREEQREREASSPSYPHPPPPPSSSSNTRGSDRGRWPQFAVECTHQTPPFCFLDWSLDASTATARRWTSSTRQVDRRSVSCT
uniref:Putative secreted protein n=1 Tax=Anopheles marajoara TaxID=58244 RepID=A0A2M4C620_9DIPT